MFDVRLNVSHVSVYDVTDYMGTWAADGRSGVASIAGLTELESGEVSRGTFRHWAKARGDSISNRFPRVKLSMTHNNPEFHFL